MANRIYKSGAFHFQNGDLALASDNLKIALCSSAYTPLTQSRSLGGDEFLNVIPGGAIVATSGNLTSKVLNAPDGSLQAANPVIGPVSGSTITQLVLYNDTGSSATSQLIFLYDTATNMPLVPNGGNITIQFAGAPNYVFSFNLEVLSDEERSLVQRIGDALRGIFGRRPELCPAPMLVLS